MGWSLTKVSSWHKIKKYHEDSIWLLHRWHFLLFLRACPSHKYLLQRKIIFSHLAPTPMRLLPIWRSINSTLFMKSTLLYQARTKILHTVLSVFSQLAWVNSTYKMVRKESRKLLWTLQLQPKHVVSQYNHSCLPCLIISAENIM